MEKNLLGIIFQIRNIIVNNTIKTNKLGKILLDSLARIDLLYIFEKYIKKTRFKAIIMH